MTTHPVKLGTMPGLLEVDGRSRVAVGNVIRVRQPRGYSRVGTASVDPWGWFRVRVDEIGPDGHLFLSYD